MTPGYLTLLPAELTRRAQQALARLSTCDLCPRRCGADRTRSIKRAACRTGRHAVVSSFGPHHGEEACLSGIAGSGTIFFAGCNLRCLFCQNWETSWENRGRPVSADELAAMMLELQSAGCHNINLVSPTHVTAQILEAVVIAAARGLRLPLVWNSGGYDAVETLALLDGVVDIYMPDMKYANDSVARICSGITGYVDANRAAVIEMHRQVGDLRLGSDSLAFAGLLVRHLVLPDGLAGTAEVMGFLARQVSPATAVNIMDQYRPLWRADRHPRLAKRPTTEELAEARQTAGEAGLGDGRMG